MSRLAGLLAAIIMIFTASCTPSTPQAVETQRPMSTSTAAATDLPKPSPTPTTTTPAAFPTPTIPPVSITADNVDQLIPVQILTGHTDDVTRAIFSPDGSTIASSSLDGTIRLWQVSDGTLIHTLAGHTAGVHSLSFSPDGNILASASDDRTVRLWDTQNGDQVKSLSNSIMGIPLEVVFSPDGSLLAIAGNTCYVQLCNPESGILRQGLAQPNCSGRSSGSFKTWGIAFSPDGSKLATGDGCASSTGSLQLWQVREYVQPQLLEGYRLSVSTLAYSPEGSTIAVALTGSPSFWLLSVEDGSLLHTFEGHTLRINRLAYSPDGSLLASASRDKTIRLWQVSIRDLLEILEGHSEAVNSVDFSPDGSLIVSASDDDSLIVWSLAHD